jgi:hypothetical protein
MAFCRSIRSYVCVNVTERGRTLGSGFTASKYSHHVGCIFDTPVGIKGYNTAIFPEVEQKSLLPGNYSISYVFYPCRRHWGILSYAKASACTLHFPRESGA